MLCPVVDLFLKGLGERTSTEEQVALAHRCLNEIKRFESLQSPDSYALHGVLQWAISGAEISAQSYLGRSSSSAPRESSSFSTMLRQMELTGLNAPEQFETSPELQTLQLIGLRDEIEMKGEGDQNGIFTQWLEKYRSAPWEDSRVDVAAARPLTAVIFCGLKAGFVTPDQAGPLLLKQIGNLTPDDWFYPEGILYGSSFLLRSLLTLSQVKWQGLSVDYIKEVSERLLQVIEIKRQRAFEFRMKSVPKDASYPLERLRFTLALFEAAGVFNDIRFLNAGLKMNDWNTKTVCRIKVEPKSSSGNSLPLMIKLHYIMSIACQERRWTEFYPA